MLKDHDDCPLTCERTLLSRSPELDRSTRRRTDGSIERLTLIGADPPFAEHELRAYLTPQSDKATTRGEVKKKKQRSPVLGPRERGATAALPKLSTRSHRISPAKLTSTVLVYVLARWFPDERGPAARIPSRQSASPRRGSARKRRSCRRVFFANRDAAPPR